MSMLLRLLSNQQFQIIAVVQLFNIFSTNLLAPVLPVYFKMQGMSESQIGLIMGIVSLGALVVRPWTGMSVDIKGSRSITLFGQVLTAAGLAFYFWASGFWQYLLIRFYQGIAMAFYGTGAITFASGVESPENTSAAIAYFSLCTMIGMGIATSIAPVIFSGYGFFSLIFLGLASISMATSLMWLRSNEVIHCGEDKRIPFREVLKAKEVLAPAVCLFGSNFALGTAFTFVPLVALSKNIAAYSVFFIAFSGAVVFARAMVHQINKRWNPERTALYASLINALSTGLLAVYPSTLTFTLSGALVGFGFGIIYPTLAAYVVDRVSPANKGSALSVIAAAGDVGNALGASVLGIVAETMGFSVLFAGATIIILLSGYYFYKALWVVTPSETLDV
ncbi:MFS transporter [Sporomusa sp.]|uniref:MFS transporter n=1 Tax=Sporomusa sp. TaxID=2078658 RepID=UPI002B7A51C0|nr:MFS transporter [Sporomusa sp.]HWR42236.1 MFS transporter [Sporomusa sp.]